MRAQSFLQKFGVTFHDATHIYPFEFIVHKRNELSECGIPQENFTGTQYEIEITNYPLKIARFLNEETSKPLKVVVDGEKMFVNHLPEDEGHAIGIAILWARYSIVYITEGEAEFDEVALKKYPLTYRYTAA